MINKIPKVIYYGWFGGGEKSILIKSCLKSWKKVCPDYKIIEYTEKDFNFSNAPIYVKKAIEQKRWSKVNNWARLKTIYENGGIYLDTDVELVKRPDNLLKYDAFFALQPEKVINTGNGFGAVKGHPIIRELLNVYENLGENFAACTTVEGEVFKAHGFNGKDETQELDEKVVALSSKYMCPQGVFSEKRCKIDDDTISIHYFDASWINTSVLRQQEYLINKYGFKRFKDGRASKIELLKNDVRSVKKDEGRLHALLYYIKHFFYAYFKK